MDRQDYIDMALGATVLITVAIIGLLLVIAAIAQGQRKRNETSNQTVQGKRILGLR